MGLITLTLTGCGFVLIGALELLTSSKTHLPNASSPSIHRPIKFKSSSSTTLTFLSIFAFSFSSIVDSLISISDASTSSDRLGSALQLQSLSVASLFLVYSILGLIRDLYNDSARFRLPSSVLDLVLAFGFVEELLLFYLQRKDPIGVENRYFDLLLLPISVCVVSTVLGLFGSADVAKMGRGVGLVLQGTWFFQMGLSFYSDFMAHGCSLIERSRGNYTIRCKGHQDYHRGRAIATLQFNCHLAFMVVVGVGLYSVLVDRSGARGGGSRVYRPIGGEMGRFHGHPHFSLDSDGDDDDGIGEQKLSGADMAMEASVNGRGLYQ